MEKCTFWDGLIADPPISGPEAKLVLDFRTWLDRDNFLECVFSELVDGGAHLVRLPCRVRESAGDEDGRLRPSLSVGEDDQTLCHDVSFSWMMREAAEMCRGEAAEKAVQVCRGDIRAVYFRQYDACLRMMG